MINAALAGLCVSRAVSSNTSKFESADLIRTATGIRLPTSGVVKPGERLHFERERNRILVDNPQTLYGFPQI
jgi:hypothetical protein